MNRYILKIALLTFSIIGFVIAGILSGHFFNYVVSCLNFIVLVLMVKEKKRTNKD